MKQVHLRIPDDLHKLIQAYADTRGITFTAAVNVLLHEAVRSRSTLSTQA